MPGREVTTVREGRPISSSAYEGGERTLERGERTPENETKKKQDLLDVDQPNAKKAQSLFREMR